MPRALLLLDNLIAIITAVATWVHHRDASKAAGEIADEILKGIEEWTGEELDTFERQDLVDLIESGVQLFEPSINRVLDEEDDDEED